MSLRRGANFEQRVYSAIKRLEKIRFARALKKQDLVVDRDGHTRRVDLSFILCTWAVEILISVECKSRARSVTLDEIDQLKVLKRELPERNIFWLVSEGEIGDNASQGLRSAGISFYEIEDLEAIVDEICKKFRRSGIKRMRHVTRMLSTMHPGAYGEAAAALKRAELQLLTSLGEVHALLSQYGSCIAERFP